MKLVIDKFMECAQVYMKLIDQSEKVMRDYGGIELYPSEVHTLVSIQDNCDVNMTQIAQKMGVTKGAINKIVQKLEKKELIERYKIANNNKNIYFKLTEKGIKAYKGHFEFHKNLFNPPSLEFEEFVSENQVTILKMFDFSKEYLNEHIKKLEEEDAKNAKN